MFALYVIAGLLCFVGMLQYVGELGNVFAIIRDSFIQLSGEGQLIAQIIWNLFCIFVGWIEVVMVGYLAVIGSRTILRNSKYAGGISIVAFFGITFIIEKIYNLISNVLPNVEVEGDSFFGVGYPAYYIIICVIVFYLADGWQIRSLVYKKSPSIVRDFLYARNYYRRIFFISSGSSAVNSIGSLVIG